MDKWAIGFDSEATEFLLEADTIGIADFAFTGCSKLESFTVPNTVMFVGKNAFEK